jgi:hypothetical protein
MSEQTFRSPGFFEQEIDLSAREAASIGIPAGIAGTALKGPAFVPITVGSFIDFDNKFGTLHPEMYGTYAAREHLKNRTALTYVRVLGAGANETEGDMSDTDSKGIVKNAGFVIKGLEGGNGCVKFLIAQHEAETEESYAFPIFTDNKSFSAPDGTALVGEQSMIRAMIFMAKGYDLRLQSNSIETNVDEGQKTFSMELWSDTELIKTYEVSLDPVHPLYISKVLNVDPYAFKESRHLLYADFPVEDELAKVQGKVRILTGSSNEKDGIEYRDLFGRFDTRYTTPRTTSFISQPFGTKEYDLFHFETISDGAYGNDKFKVSIANLRVSTDQNNPFGTFEVQVRNYEDTDTSPQILEAYPNCNLNPRSDRYVAKIIGDKKAYFDFDQINPNERRLVVEGKYPNRSQRVRIRMNSAVENGDVPRESLPFGFRGLPVLKTADTLTASNSVHLISSDGRGLGSFNERFLEAIEVQRPNGGTTTPPANGISGLDGTGSGGGGGRASGNESTQKDSGKGGDGVVIIRYRNDSGIVANGGQKFLASVDGITYTVHRFTTDGAFVTDASSKAGTVEYLIIGGGGGGGMQGGGSAGALVEGSASVVHTTSYAVEVGTGGPPLSGQTNGVAGNPGTQSSAFNVTADGGAGGGTGGSGGQGLGGVAAGANGGPGIQKDITGEKIFYGAGGGAFGDTSNGLGGDLGTLAISPIVPPVPFRFKVTRGPLKEDDPSYIGEPGSNERTDARMYWGVMTKRLPTKNSLVNPLLEPNSGALDNDLLKSYSKFLGIQKLGSLLDASEADDFNNNKFTLARVALVEQIADASEIPSIPTVLNKSAAEHMLGAVYVRNAVPDRNTYTVSDRLLLNRITLATLVNTNPIVFNRFVPYAKFTNVFYGGFDGVNVLDRDIALFKDRALSDETGGKATEAQPDIGLEGFDGKNQSGWGRRNNGIASYNKAIDILTDPMSSNINVLATPGIREPLVTDHAMIQVQDYSRAIYVLDLIKYDEKDDRIYDDTKKKPDVRRTAELFEARVVDNNYVATYFPDVKIDDPINNRVVSVPASVAAIGALSYNDRVAFPWYAPAGFNRGGLEFVRNIETRLNSNDRDVLYDARINPIAVFPNSGFVIFGQKTLQQTKSALDRVNVRRLMLEIKRQVTSVANGLLFEPNNAATRARFVNSVTPLLGLVQLQAGIEQFRVIMDDTNNSVEDVESNRLNGRIVVVPTRAVEFISVDFIITNSGVSFL